MQKTKIQIAKEIQVVLFYLAEPTSYKYLAEIIGVSEKEIAEAVDYLSESLKSEGICIVTHDDEIVLTTAPEMSSIVEKVVADERQRDLGKASMETLAIIAYKGPVSRKEIEYIRGVNCQFSLQTLLLRGLVEKKTKDGDERAFVYRITMDALLHLGLKNVNELPEYDKVNKELNVQEENPEETFDQEENYGEQ